MVADKNQKWALAMDLAIARSSNTKRKKYEKPEKYQKFEEELEL